MKSAYLFFGLPGSGKGTQNALLKKHFEDQGKSVYAFEMGSSLRKMFSDADSKYGKKMNELINGGYIISPGVPVSVFIKDLLDNYNDEEVLLIDGAFRTLPQAKLIFNFVKFLEFSNFNVFAFDISKEEITKRLKLRGRGDDTDEGIAKRISEFEDQENGTILTYDWMEKMSEINLYRIDGKGTTEEVQDRVLGNLK